MGIVTGPIGNGGAILRLTWDSRAARFEPCSWAGMILMDSRGEMSMDSRQQLKAASELAQKNGVRMLARSGRRFICLVQEMEKPDGQ
jgi:hypothetical protein